MRHYRCRQLQPTELTDHADKFQIMASPTASKLIPHAPSEVLSRNPQLRLSDPEMKPTMAAFRERIMADPTFGRHLLQESGIVDAKGRLKKSFGG